ncbi:MAG: hypothetical protein IKH59_09685 [Bacteroidaceae bacterium]|nr:hypothetical protein [Bacteroidaceae bacterium]
MKRAKRGDAITSNAGKVPAGGKKVPPWGKKVPSDGILEEAAAVRAVVKAAQRDDGEILRKQAV